MDYEGRQGRLRQALAKARAEALLVTHMPNIRYLCGFTGSSGALVLGEAGTAFFTDGRYTEQARSEVRGARVVIARGATLAAAVRWLQRKKFRRVGFEGERMTAAAALRLKEGLDRGARLVATSGLVERVRMVKEPEELERIRAAVKLGSKLYEQVVGRVRPGILEMELAAELEYWARRAGAEGMAFDTIVAGGRRGAMPHGRASSQPIPNKGFVIFDLGVILGGYCSDMTRTLHVGEATGRARQVYEAVREAQLAAIAAVRPGRPASDVDAAARRVLRRAGLDRSFTHSTGHGLGLEIHEPPRLGRGQPELLEAGMAITVEPGVYIPGWGGVRIEDVVVVREGAAEVLTPTSKQLLSV